MILFINKNYVILQYHEILIVESRDIMTDVMGFLKNSRKKKLTNVNRLCYHFWVFCFYFVEFEFKRGLAVKV